MSRLLVKGLPAIYSSHELQQEFKKEGFTLTDCKILTKSNGSSRRMAFVGLATEKDGEKAIERLNKVWVQGGRLEVEFARIAAKDQFERPLKKRKLELPASQENVQDDGIADNEELTDAEYLAKRRKRTLGDPADASVPEAPAAPSPFANGRLFLRNLPYSITQQELESTFKSYGDLTEVKVPVSANGQCTGIAYITFLASSSAQRAHDELDGKPLMGRLLHILPAADRREGTFKGKEQDIKQLLQGGKFKKDFDKNPSRHDQTRGDDTTLVLNSDAVVSSLANILNLSKTDVLDPTSSSAAVKLAQAETSLLASSMDYFLSHGADLKSLSTAAKGSEKSATTVLLTNLPPVTIQATLRSLLNKYGTIKKLLVPPSGTLAAVEMAEPTQLTDVINSLSYQKLGNSVIYVKRVPATFWTTPVKSANNPTEHTEPEEDDSQTPTKTLFVQNVSYAVTQDRFSRAFKSLPGFAFAKLLAPDDPKKTHSKGYGFVGFTSVEHATSARDSMQGHLLDGRALNVSYAKNRAEEAQDGEEEVNLDLGAQAKKGGSAKMLVKNVPFEASLKDLKELFSAYGSVKSVRLPKRADRRSRGFAFVEFANRKECEYAMKVLQNTHLLGRHLKFEFVKDEKLEELLAE